MKKADSRNRKFWAGVSPWIIIGAVVIIVPIFAFMTVQNINKQKEYTTQLLVEKGAALMRSFEAGARTGIEMRWSSFQLQKLLIETAQQPDIDHLIVTDTNGKIVADSDPSMIGEHYGTDLDLQQIAASNKLAWRQVPNFEGADTFEVYRQFAPTEKPFSGFQEEQSSGKRSSRERLEKHKEAPSGYIIFVGMDMGPVITAREQDMRHTILMAVIFVLIGCAGIISLFLAQGYRTAKTSLSRVQAFSDSLVENMPMGLLAVNDRGEIISFNQTAEAILGYSHGDVLGKKADEIMPPHCMTLLTGLKTEKKIVEEEIDCALRDGRTISLEVIATVLEEEDGNFLGYVILFRDITEVKHLKTEMERGRRLASVGSLAAGVAHEIRNPLSSIKGFATFFKERYRENPEDRKTAEVMVEEVERLNRVIGQLLDLARPMKTSGGWTSVEDVIRHTVKMIDEQAKAKEITIRVDISQNIGDIFMDRDRITQVLLNLYLNALEAMEKGGTLTIAALPQEGRVVRIDVSDTGKGIDEKDLPRVFDPYFTTRSSGTGLGMAIVHKIMEAHDGEIRIVSEPGKGTTVSIFLPLGPDHNKIS